VVIEFPHARVLDNPVLAARWRREASLTEALSHPNLKCRLDVGERHQEPYLVFEYAGGGSLDGWVSALGPGMPFGQAVRWGCQLAQALAYLQGYSDRRAYGRAHRHRDAPRRLDFGQSHSAVIRDHCASPRARSSLSPGVRPTGGDEADG
jgi:serine/threonine protein kinase